VLDGEASTRDDTGVELPGLEAAEDEAVCAIVEIGQDSLPKRRGPELALHVRDEQGRPVLTVTLLMRVCRPDPANS
jgi:hypothetical protein